MALSTEQIEKLLQLISATTPDLLDCDGCLDHVAEFAEAQLTGKSLSESMLAIESHLRNCACCQDEFQFLMDAIQGMNESA